MLYLLPQSSLLMTILGELPLSEGTITVKGKIAYASQQAWVYNGSLRQNILFGQDYNKDKFTEVIKACALDKVPMQHLHVENIPSNIFCHCQILNVMLCYKNQIIVIPQQMQQQNFAILRHNVYHVSSGSKSILEYFITTEEDTCPLNCLMN